MFGFFPTPPPEVKAAKGFTCDACDEQVQSVSRRGEDWVCKPCLNPGVPEPVEAQDTRKILVRGPTDDDDGMADFSLIGQTLD